MSKEIFQRIWATTLVLLGAKEYTYQQLQQKLQRKFPHALEVIAEVLQKCQEQNFINDQKYAENYIRYRQGTAPRGKFVLQQELRQKGIAADIIAPVLAEISDQEEYNSARGLMHKKLSSLPHDLDVKKKREKIFRFLISRGFSQTLIFEVLDEFTNNK